MKKLTSLLLCIVMLMTMAIPVFAEGTDESQPAGQSSTTTTLPSESQHVCNFQLTGDTATCTAVGVKTYTCSCGETNTEDSPMKDHSFGAAASVDAANHKKVCSVCQHEVVSAHVWNDGAETTPANCKQDGVKTYTCTGCSATKTETIPKTTTHTYGSWTTTATTHERTCTVCQVKESGSHTMKEEVTKAATCKETGTKKNYCTVCDYGSGETVVIPKLTTHTYDNACDAECNVCSIKREIEHTYTKVWSTNSKGHWYECTKCEGQKDYAKHVPGPAATEEKEQVCLTCGYVITPRKNHVHSYGAEWTGDEVGHWHACTGCKEEKDYASHVYKDDCDAECDTCGYKRENAHKYDQEGWLTSKFDHWNVCTVCGEESKHEKHVPGAEATDKEAQLCSICSYELAPAVEHVHDFGTKYQTSDDTHWQECVCGELSVPEAHTWDAGKKNKNDTITFRCTGCGSEKTEDAPSSGFSWVTFILVILALICIGGITAIVILLKRGGFEEDDGIPEAESEEEGPDLDDEEEQMIDDYFASIDTDLYK